MDRPDQIMELVKQSRIAGIRKRAGRCYELAYMLFQQPRRGNPPPGVEWDRLCHGYLSFQGACIHHAWLETGEYAYDPVMDLVTTKDAYYRLYDPQDVKRYTARQVARNALTSGTSGPWEEVDMSRIKLLSTKGKGEVGGARHGV